jgi:uncharacterized repeat protein (TIGR01451 family)
MPEATLLLVPEITVGVETLGTLTSTGAGVLYKVRPPTGSDIQFTLHRDDGGQTEIFASVGQSPTAGTFDVHRSSRAADTLFAISSALDDDYYILVVPRTLPAGAAPFTIQSTAMGFALDSIGITAGGNAGPVTIPLNGTRFRDGLTATLVSSDNVDRPAQALRIVDSGLAFATFDLAGLTNGEYDVRANDGLGATSTLPDRARGEFRLRRGIRPAGFVAPSDTLAYTIHFENQPTATAPAQQVTVTDQLAPNINWTSIELATIGFNGVIVNVPTGLTSFATTTNVATDANPVRLAAAFDSDTGVLSWTIESFDPVTGQLPEDPLAGFLPPNNADRQGEGFVSFTARPVAGLMTGSTIRNQARIVFDVNAPIDTNEVINTIDTGAPTSELDPLPAGSPSVSR